MPGINNLFQLTFRQLFDEQVCENVFFYQNYIGASPDTAGLFGAFVSDVVPLINGFQNAGATNVSAVVLNLDDPNDFYEDGIIGAGASMGDYEPPFVAYAFRYNRYTRDSRNGAKRFVGVTSADLVDGVATGSVVAELNACAGQLLLDLVNGGVHYRPIIFRRPSSANPLGTAFLCGTVEYVRVTTQNSRKLGRGI